MGKAVGDGDGLRREIGRGQKIKGSRWDLATAAGRPRGEDQRQGMRPSQTDPRGLPAAAALRALPSTAPYRGGPLGALSQHCAHGCGDGLLHHGPPWAAGSRCSAPGAPPTPTSGAAGFSLCVFSPPLSQLFRTAVFPILRSAPPERPTAQPHGVLVLQGPVPSARIESQNGLGCKGAQRSSGSNPLLCAGRQPAAQAAQSHIQPGLERQQGRGIHSLLRQPGRAGSGP